MMDMQAKKSSADSSATNGKTQQTEQVEYVDADRPDASLRKDEADDGTFDNPLASPSDVQTL